MLSVATMSSMHRREDQTHDANYGVNKYCVQTTFASVKSLNSDSSLTASSTSCHGTKVYTRNRKSSVSAVAVALRDFISNEMTYSVSDSKSDYSSHSYVFLGCTSESAS